MFEQAAKQKLRFDSIKGNLTTEDLFDLPLTSTKQNVESLDNIARGIHAKLKNSEDISFVSEVSKKDEILQLKLDVVKHIIKVKKEEAAQASTLKARKEEKQDLLAIIAEKEKEATKGLTLEELKAKVAALP